LLAFLQGEWIPMFADCTSASIPLSQVVHRRPRGLLQSLGGRSDALTARWRPCLESECATWPKKNSLLVLMVLETGGQPVVSIIQLIGYKHYCKASVNGGTSLPQKSVDKIKKYEVTFFAVWLSALSSFQWQHCWLGNRKAIRLVKEPSQLSLRLLLACHC